MKLVELIKYLINPGQLDELFIHLGLNLEAEVYLIYLESRLNLESEVCIFPIEETDDDLIFEKDGKRYIQLFSIDHAVDLIEYDLDLNNKNYSDIEIARQLLDYRQKDA
ncbi:hypothetical protein [Sphingobacterium sp. MYb388]|uniref:hypothetical protein n=1 Tax=Sphingobacterium sp. MYb388 TaxID=2745437 RepID=UPI0030A7900F